MLEAEVRYVRGRRYPEMGGGLGGRRPVSFGDLEFQKRKNYHLIRNPMVQLSMNPEVEVNPLFLYETYTKLEENSILLLILNSIDPLLLLFAPSCVIHLIQ